MNLSEVQTVYYLLHRMQHKLDVEKKIDFELVVDYNGQLITAEFLTLNKNKSAIIKEKFTYDFDVDEIIINTGFPNKAALEWDKLQYDSFISTDKVFKRPDLLLQNLLTFISSLEKSEEDNIPITNVITNVNYLASNTWLDFAILDNTSYKVISLVVN